jgi:short-subunit dehydrogenase
MMPSVTVITGASTGLGRALSPLLASDGHKVALLARRVDLLTELADEINADPNNHGEARAYACDVSKPDEVREVFARVKEELGAVDRLVANAGVGDSSPARNFKGEAVARVMEVNYLGAVYCIEQVLPEMLERKEGQIVGVSSLAAYIGLPGNGAYCASKAALSSLLTALRVELRAKGVAVTTICPGFVRTPMTDRNQFPMPFLMEVDKAAAHMHRAIQRRVAEYSFPWALSAPVRIARWLPPAIYDRLLAGKEASKSPQRT